VVRCTAAVPILLAAVSSVGDTRLVSDQSIRLRVRAASDGCYEAPRAAALSGVPLSTVYWWARQGIVVPSVSPTREKLWSYADLMGLRVVSWLRHAKPGQLPASPMPEVRKALALLAEQGLEMWDPGASRSSIIVDGRGALFVRSGDAVLDSSGRPTLLSEQHLGLTEPFSIGGVTGPDLIAPRRHLRIVPAKVSGEPHIENSRITTITLAALGARRYGIAQIAEMYEVSEAAVAEALDLEDQLAQPSPAAA
jgi:uncharacterized protein (DUF433 family)